MTIESGTWMAEGPPQEETEAAVAHLLKEALILIRFELAPLGDDRPERQRMHRVRGLNRRSRE
jgi:hypothetical protein